MSGTLMNTGHDVKLVLDEPSPHYINISGGPYVYQYRVSEILIHFGSIDSLGSEHTIDGMSFPAEVHVQPLRLFLYIHVTCMCISMPCVIIHATCVNLHKHKYTYCSRYFPDVVLVK